MVNVYIQPPKYAAYYQGLDALEAQAMEYEFLFSHLVPQCGGLSGRHNAPNRSDPG